MTKNTITKLDDITWEVSDGEDNSFKIYKTPEAFNIDGHFYVEVEELQNIMTEIRLKEAFKENVTDLD